jgi:mono/diheme cytochrome c family protein
MKKNILRITLVLLGLVVLLVAGGLIYLKTALPDVGPAPELKVEMTAARIERGKYLANHVAVCMDCHSQRDFSRFAGPVKDGTLGGGGEKFGPELGFPGTFYSKNITPYALKDWTDGEIYRAITAGVSRKGEALFPVMPYHGFGQMDDKDIHAIIAYIRTVPPVKNDVPASRADFPMNFILQTMPVKGTPQPLPDKSDVLAYGKYLTTFSSCGECHTKRDKGTPLPGMEFAGGMEFQLPHAMVRSANLTPDQETGIGTWTEEMFVKRFKMYADSTYHNPAVAKDDFNTIMPWMMFAGMEETDLKAIFAYLKTLKPVNHKVVKFEPNSTKTIAAAH